MKLIQVTDLAVSLELTREQFHIIRDLVSEAIAEREAKLAWA
jgi:hypothetical protein